MKNSTLSVIALSLFMIALIIKTQSNSKNELQEIITIFQDHESYDKKKYPLGLFTKEHYESEADFAKDLLIQLKKINIDDLDENDLISYKLLKFELNDIVDYFHYKRYLNPLLSDSGFHINLNYIVRPLNSYKKTIEYLNKLNSFPEFVDQNITNLSAGLNKGVSQPLIIFKGYESTYNDHITDNYLDNYFYSPFKNLPNDISKTQIDSIYRVAKNVINEVVVPEFKKIKHFFENEYYTNTRQEIGISSTPNGVEYYQNRINYYTTSKDYTAKKIHQIGLNEVARIKSEMKKIIKDLKFKGSFEDFLKFLRADDQFYANSSKELLMFARDIAKRADEQLPRFFKTLPRKPYGVAPVPKSIAPKYTTGRYIGTSKNSTEPGYYWVNTYDLKSRTLYTLPALTAHEAVPGHHLQVSLNNELGEKIPLFRRNLYLSAYGEGWGLYSEFLAEEMGLYTTHYEKFGKLTYEMWRACRLVVDTGIHAFGWSKQKAIDYMSLNTALSFHEINTETDRYISWPGQALSYKIGELKIRELRTLAESKLGSNFNIRDFHEIILSEGTITLEILESRVLNYIKKNMQ
tara:strand:- start:791 stop:2518 length:1728 start_codon:yes stop_codon:yes gene_type:complete